MSKVVVILGAGSSADFGVPTLAGMFKDKIALRYLNKNKLLMKHLEEIFWVPRGHSLKTAAKSLTIEEMLTILRGWEQEKGSFKKPKKAFLSRFKKSLYILIQHAVYEEKSASGRHLNKLIEYLEKSADHTTWASFNWDCIFEGSFWYIFSDLNYSNGNIWRSGRNPKLVVQLKNWRNPTRSRHTFLKLHGGVNWWMVGGAVTYLPFGIHGGLNSKWAEYEQNEETEDFPVILEPSAYKYHPEETYRLLEPQWEVFLERLCEADHVIIIGYSLPELDSQARSKILTAFQVNDAATWAVVDPDPGVIERYEHLLGNRLNSFRQSLSEFNNDLDDNVAVAFGQQPF